MCLTRWTTRFGQGQEGPEQEGPIRRARFASTPAIESRPPGARRLALKRTLTRLVGLFCPRPSASSWPTLGARDWSATCKRWGPILRTRGANPPHTGADPGTDPLCVFINLGTNFGQTCTFIICGLNLPVPDIDQINLSIS